MSNHPAAATYDYRNCQSLFGYAAAVHARSGGICQLCDADGGTSTFDFWRQLTVEHLIGESQGGYLERVKESVAKRFSDLSPVESVALAERIEELNTVTACSFCNATTSRTRTEASMTELIERAPNPDSAEASIRNACEAILASKRADVAWKIASVRRAYEELVVPAMNGGEFDRPDQGRRERATKI